MKLLSWIKRNGFKITVISLLLLLVLVALSILGTLPQTEAIKSETATSTKFYINKDGANTRACPSTDCKIIGYQKLNDWYDLTFNSLEDLPEWVYIETFIIGSEEEGRIEAYIHKSNFALFPAEQKPQTIVQTRVVEKDSQISSVDIQPYLTGVVNLSCYDGQSRSEGSASLWDFNGEKLLLTNRHVVEINLFTNRVCRFWTNMGGYYADASSPKEWNSLTDVSILKIYADTENSPESTLGSLNTKVGNLSSCPKETPVGTPIVIIGFPAYAEKTTYIEGLGYASNSARVVTNGIVSGYDDSTKFPGKLPASDYYISAKIDSGNSGGIALAKIDGKMCLLGIPTWLTVGNYETQGLVQNIHNIFYKPN